MAVNSGARISILCCVAVAALLLAAAAPGTAHQAGQGAPGGDKSAAGHLAQMAAFRRTVPEDYRIMERTPIIDSLDSLRSGRTLYMRHCAECHGRLGRGDGPKAAGMKHRPADFLDFQHSNHYPPGVKYWLIAKGNAELGMPAHPQLAPRDVWHTVNYLLAMQAKAQAERARPPAKTPAHEH